MSVGTYDRAERIRRDANLQRRGMEIAFPGLSLPCNNAQNPFDPQPQKSGSFYCHPAREDGNWIFGDHNAKYGLPGGDCFDALQKSLNISFAEALELIDPADHHVRANGHTNGVAKKPTAPAKREYPPSDSIPQSLDYQGASYKLTKIFRAYEDEDSTKYTFAEARYEILDADGKRLVPKQPRPFTKSADGYRMTGSPSVPYGLPSLLVAARENEPTRFLCEGAPDVDAVQAFIADVGIADGMGVATAKFAGIEWGKEGKPGADWNRHLINADGSKPEVFLFADTNKAGVKYAGNVARRLLDDGFKVRIVRVPIDDGDIRDWLEAEPRTADEFRALLDSATAALTEEQEREQAERAEYEKFLQTCPCPSPETRPPYEPPLLTLNGVRIGSRGNITVFTGMPSSGKSAIAESVLSAAVAGRQGREIDSLGIDVTPGATVVYIDGERTLADFHTAWDRVNRRAGMLQDQRLPDGVQMRPVKRIIDIQERQKFVWQIMRFERPDILILDAATHFTDDANDKKESEIFIRRLSGEAEIYGCTVVCIVHVNPAGGVSTGEKPQGHFGSIITRTAETVLLVKRDKQTDAGTITTRFANGKNRNGEHVTGGFKWDDNRKMFVSDEPPQVVTLGSLSAMQKRVCAAFSGVSRMSRSQLKTTLAAANGTSEKTADREIVQWLKNGLIHEVEKVGKTSFFEVSSSIWDEEDSPF